MSTGPSKENVHARTCTQKNIRIEWLKNTSYMIVVIILGNWTDCHNTLNPKNCKPGLLRCEKRIILIRLSKEQLHLYFF